MSDLQNLVFCFSFFSGFIVFMFSVFLFIFPEDKKGFKKKVWNPFYLDSIILTTFVLMIFPVYSVVVKGWGYEGVFFVKLINYGAIIFMFINLIIFFILRLNFKRRLRKNGYEIKMFSVLKGIDGKGVRAEN